MLLRLWGYKSYSQVKADWHTDVISARTKRLEAIWASSKLAWKNSKILLLSPHHSSDPPTLFYHTPRPSLRSAGCSPGSAQGCPAVQWALPRWGSFSHWILLTPSHLPAWTPLSKLCDKERTLKTRFSIFNFIHQIIFTWLDLSQIKEKETLTEK